MKTIEERADNYTCSLRTVDIDYLLGSKFGYIQGAKEQQEIDIERAWEWIKTELIDKVSFIGTNHNQYEWEYNFKKMMKGE